MCFWLILLTVLWLELWHGLGCFRFIYSSWMNLKQKIHATSAPTALQLLMGLKRAKPKAAPQNQNSVDAKSSLFCLTDLLLPDYLLTYIISNSITLQWYNSVSTTIGCSTLLLLYLLWGNWKTLTYSQALGTAALRFVLVVLCTASVVQSGNHLHVVLQCPSSSTFQTLWG